MASDANEADAARIEENRLYWRSRRGLLELDLVLPGFVRQCYAGMQPEQQACYRRLLECEDQDILSWIQGLSRPQDAELAALIDLIRDHHHGSAADR